MSFSFTKHEVVTVFPTYALLSEDGLTLKVNIHAWVYEPEERSLKRKALLYLLSKRLGLDPEQAESKYFHDRAKLFLVDNERGRKISLRLGGQVYELGPSLANGHIRGSISLPASKLSELLAEAPADALSFIQIEVSISGRKGTESSFAVPYIGPDGLSIISDLDDTIKISEVADRRALLLNTFTREFRPVSGMAKLYQAWSSRGASFHYVSAAPWQLQQPLREFLGLSGFPAGSMALKTFRWKDSSFFDLFADSDQIKKPFIEQILAEFPKRKFILVGDSGEQDPELYGAVARAHPEQVANIFIRKAGSDNLAAARWAQAFEGWPDEKWSLFSDARELYSESLSGLSN